MQIAAGSKKVIASKLAFTDNDADISSCESRLEVQYAIFSSVPFKN